ncbi:uncharacterized protein BX664DRAFT_323828 [Halteromyces radiatus]|uniref:uncharacterized protein n=1 Tax=Halteromyces radiatus TaxID=101107 RepID=UPI0022202260|nr:uncharacterized protein BX664DRAFT_323828 [Halteromyces radiatus]KAI8096366.1 hypothetical protein BX664DRAFT_323828 [Halteromyces radiatus]
MARKPTILTTSKETKSLHRTLSSESKHHQNGETWKIARRPTGSSTTSSSLASPLSALSRSFSIESTSSPLTPHIEQRPYMSFRVQSNHQKLDQSVQEETTISFFKLPTMPSSSKLASHYHHLHRQGNPTCFRCKRSIQSNLIRIGSNYAYHSHCLTCFLCRDPLSPQKEIQEYNGIVYCPKDYQLIQSRPTCATCHHTINPPVRPTKAFGAYYHPEHLLCHHCHKPVDEHTTGMVRHKRKIYCRPDFNHLFLPSCRGCGRAVERESVSSSDGKMGGKWHIHCFRCQACHQPFKDNTFYVFKDKPYCQRDYHRLNQSLCAKCDTPIEGRCAQTSLPSTPSSDDNDHTNSKDIIKKKVGDRYHPHCFTCHTCGVGIKDIYYSDHHHRIYCPNHGKHNSYKRTTIFHDLSSSLPINI